MPEIKEKLLKDSHTRSIDDTRFVTKVAIDTRKDTHDILTVFVRGTPVGQLVMEKSESLQMSRRILPPTLEMDKEPGELVSDLEALALAYVEAIAEIALAISYNSTSGLSAFMKKLESSSGNPDYHHTRVRGILHNRTLRMSPEAATAASTLLPDRYGR